jgi:hypothetical protein
MPKLLLWKNERQRPCRARWPGSQLRTMLLQPVARRTHARW